MGTATFISERTSRAGARQRLYRLSRAVEYERGGDTDHVVVSALPKALDTGQSETYIFPARATGEIITYVEMEGSFRGGCDHARALRGLGFESVD